MRFEIHRAWDGSACDAGEAVVVDATLRGDWLDVRISAPWHGDAAPEGPPGPRPALWNHEVVELFVVGRHDRYLELEFGPHGHHLALQLDGVRNVVQSAMPLEFTARRDGARWFGEARVPAVWLPQGPHTANAYAIHGAGPARRYLAHTPVPGAAPDFHRLAFFQPVDLAT